LKKFGAVLAIWNIWFWSIGIILVDYREVYEKLFEKIKIWVFLLGVVVFFG
jgi:hypothetical protein